MSCLASDHLRNLTETIAKIKSDFDALNKLVSEADKEVSAKYHEIESENFNVVQGYKLAKDLQHILQKRRAIKGEAAKLNSVMGVLRSLNIESKLPEMNSKLAALIEKDEQIKSDLKSTLRFEDLGVKLG